MFGHPQPFTGEIWEQQFDGISLEHVARSPWHELIEGGRISHYLDDLRYVELQPELFAYLFPALLAFAQRSLMGEEMRWGFDDEGFLDALMRGRWREVASPEQVEAT